MQIIIIIINGIYIALSSQVATQLGNGAANALKQLRGDVIMSGILKEQESCAVAKMTAQCALYGALKMFMTP